MTAPATVPSATLLVVDDNPANLDLLTRVLEPQGYRILVAQSGEGAITLATKAKPHLILLDVMLPGADGFETCRRLKSDTLTTDIPVIFITALNDTANLSRGFAAGGVDYVAKPFQAEEILSRVSTHLRISQLTRELIAKNKALTDEISRREQAEDALKTASDQLSDLSRREAQRWGIDGFVGKSRTIGRILDDVRRLGNFGSVNVLINGESGTGKELIARAIHMGSSRAKGPFVPVNCVAIPEDLAESMLFGHLRGAFTGATMDRKGYFEMAHQGTLFLDEIGDMSPLLQAKLLRVLEDGKVTPLGSTREKQVDVRIVAATNADLESRIANGQFRQDLYFRLAQFTVLLPPLRARTEDIPLLAAHFLSLFATEMGLKPPAMTGPALTLLCAHPFPGNVRELKNVIERALIESGGQPIRPEHLKLGPTPGGLLPSIPIPSEPPLRAEEVIEQLPLKLEDAEEMLIKRALAETNGNVAEAARRLGINRTRIYRRLAQQNS